MDTVPAESHGPSDGELIEAVRHGSTDAYRQLYERHANAARNMARQVTRSAAEVDDLVSEAFTKMLDTLRAGRGPRTSFRAYLLTILRNTAYDRSRREGKIQLAEDVSAVPGADISEPFTDPALTGFERGVVAQAFARLPERWQTVLWHLEIEGEQPTDIAPLLGMTPNGVSALAYRAREGLRQAYLQVHLSQWDTSAPDFRRCRATVDRLGAWTRSALSKRETAQIEKHLDGCERCRGLAAELAEVNDALRGMLAPAVLGTATVGYLALSGGAGASSSGATTAATSASAASSVPRQTATTSMSCAALAAVVAIALSASSQRPVPVAEPPPPPPPAQPPAPPSPTPTEPPRSTPPASPPPPTPPSSPNVEATTPTESIELVAGGSPEQLPLELRNTGDATSEPVSVTLDLPSGVHAEPTGVRATSRAASEGPCTGLDNGVRCTFPGLRPGAARTFDFELVADEQAAGGEIVVNVMSGDSLDLRLPPVKVLVTPPAPVDGVDVEARTAGRGPWVLNRLNLDVYNTGTSTGEAVAEVRVPDEVETTGLPPACELTLVGERTLRCAAELEPGESFHGVIWLTVLPDTDHDEATLPVTARLGSATDTDSASLRLDFPPEHPACDEVPDLPEELPIDLPDCPPFGKRPHPDVPGSPAQSTAQAGP